jgi:hypothetical protein
MNARLVLSFESVRARFAGNAQYRPKNEGFPPR